MKQLINIFDKSVFESLPDNHSALVNSVTFIPPILIIEILGDLTKNFKAKSAEKEVQRMMNNIQPSYCHITPDWKSLCNLDLLGYPVELKPKKFVRYGPGVVDGVKKPIQLTEEPEWELIRKCQKGEFAEELYSTSKAYRQNKKAAGLLAKIPDLLKPKAPQKLSDTTDVIRFLDISFSSPDVTFHEKMVSSACNLSECPSDMKKFILELWANDKLSLPIFAPYAYYCLRTTQMVGLSCFLKGIQQQPRKDDVIDLEYLYYLPFCTNFISNDAFHKKIVPHLLRDDQKFIEGDLFKNNLKLSIEFANQ